MDKHSREQSNAAIKPSDGIATSIKQDDDSHQPPVVRDGFSMPKEDYQLIEDIHRICLHNGVIATKSGILRAALRALSELSQDEQVTLMQSLSPIKTGRTPSQK